MIGNVFVILVVFIVITLFSNQFSSRFIEFFLYFVTNFRNQKYLELPRFSTKIRLENDKIGNHIFIYWETIFLNRQKKQAVAVSLLRILSQKR